MRYCAPFAGLAQAQLFYLLLFAQSGSPSQCEQLSGAAGLESLERAVKDLTGGKFLATAPVSALERMQPVQVSQIIAGCGAALPTSLSTLCV